MKFPRVIFFLTLLLSVFGFQAKADEMSVLQARVLTVDIVGTLILYHNPNHSASLAMQKSFERNIAALDAWVSANSIRPAADWKKLVDSIQAMEARSQHEIETDSQWMNGFLSSFGRFDDALLALQSGEAGSTLDNAVDTLNLVLARQNYLYQKVLFADVTGMELGRDDSVMPALDRTVRQSMDDLAGIVGNDRVLQKLVKRYDYIRPKLMDYEGEWFPSVVAFYSASIRDLLSKIQNRHEFKSGRLSRASSASHG